MNGFGDEQHTTDWSFDGVRQHPLFRKFVQYIILKRHFIERKRPVLKCFYETKESLEPFLYECLLRHCGLSPLNELLNNLSLKRSSIIY